MNDTTSYDIAPDDAYIASTIVDFDPIADMPSSAQIVGNVRLPETVPLSGLSPAMADPIRAELAKVPIESRQRLEAELIRKALESKSLDFKVLAGPGPNATIYQREVCAIHADIHRLHSDRMKLESDLAEVSHWTTTIDPDTGLPVPQAVEKMQGDRRKGWQERIRLIDHQITQLQGAEGAYRKKKALHASVEAFKAKRDALDEREEVKKRAAEMVREERIKTAADSRFRMMRTVV